jgi:hypothetical protein
MEFIVVIIALIFCYQLIRFVANCLSPLLEQEACVVKKRRRWVSYGTPPYMSSTRVYYITFRIIDGTHKTFKVSRKQYQELLEGDNGRLLSQGTWYKGFTAATAT